MNQRIGIVACSVEGAALCYRTIASEGARVMGEHQHPEVSLHTFTLGDYMDPIRAGDWNKVARMMYQSGEKLASIGADFLICPDNTIHQAFIDGGLAGPCPWLPITDAVFDEAASRGYERLAVLGTKYLMEGPVYSLAAERRGLEVEVPELDDRNEINRIIFSELVNGVFPESSRRYFNRVIAGMKARGCQAVVLGCTEIPLLVDPDDCPLPTLDSTRLLAAAAVRRCLA